MHHQLTAVCIDVQMTNANLMCLVHVFTLWLMIIEVDTIFILVRLFYELLIPGHVQAY